VKHLGDRHCCGGSPDVEEGAVWDKCVRGVCDQGTVWAAGGGGKIRVEITQFI
jgi:hypothetical protein